MSKTAYGFLILIGTIVTLATSYETRNIYEPPENVDISQLKGTSLPWIREEFKSDIRKFKKAVFEYIDQSESIQRVYGVSMNSSTTRTNFFKNTYTLLTNLDHPAIGAFANVVSKSGSLFDSFTVPLFFKAITVNLAEFLLSHSIDLSRSIAKSYVDNFSNYLEGVDISDGGENVYVATYKAYLNFAVSFGFQPRDIIDQYLLVFSSMCIILNDN